LISKSGNLTAGVGAAAEVFGRSGGMWGECLKEISG
jgi:hypothetical protein